MLQVYILCIFKISAFTINISSHTNATFPKKPTKLSVSRSFPNFIHYLQKCPEEYKPKYRSYLL